MNPKDRRLTNAREFTTHGLGRACQVVPLTQLIVIFWRSSAVVWKMHLAETLYFQAIFWFGTDGMSAAFSCVEVAAERGRNRLQLLI
jgi:hypothetical protein